MNIQIAVLCDAATESGGKLNLLGAFDAIQFAQFPAVLPQCCIVLRMNFNKVEEGEHKLRINFVDEDGQPIMKSIDLPIQVAMPEDAYFITTSMIVSMQQFRFPKAGLYSIDVAVDGRQEVAIPLFVKHQHVA